MTSSPRFEVRRPAVLPGLILVSATYENHVSAPHAHDEIALGLCDTGIDEFHGAGFVGRVPAGSLLAIEAGQIHEDRSARGSIRMLYAPPELFGGPLLFAQPVVHDGALTALAGAVFTAADTEAAWAAFARALTDRPWVSQGRRSTSFDELKRRLETDAPRLAELAAEAGISPSAFLRRFRQAVGCTPHEYSRQARVVRAAERIRQGDGTADAAVAEEFFDQSHFHRHFRRIYAVPPGVFRERNSVQSPSEGTKVL